MSDKGCIKIYQNDFDNEAVYLYTHNHGSEIYGFLKRALGRRERWDDRSYLARIIFCEMIKGHEADATGFGISTVLVDTDHTVLAVDCGSQEVVFEDCDGCVKSRVSMEDFVNRIDKWSPQGEV